jgi:hypothetical protein
LRYKQAIICAAASAVLFKARVGVRDRALASYRHVYVIAHTSFRFFAFWFVMFLHDRPWSFGLAVFYWVGVVFLAYPYSR